MPTVIQPELIPATDKNCKKEDALAPVTPLSLMQIALERGQVEQLQILQDMHFKELARSAEVEFNVAMNAAQTEITRVVPDAYNQQTKSKWATYAALDKMLRPIYTRHNFSLSFDSGESAPETVVAYCYVSHGAGHTRKYQSPPTPLPTMGPQGKAVMTTTHGTGAAMSYAKRYLLTFIFNIPVGEEDTDGNAAQSSRPPDQEKEYQERCAHFGKCINAEELKDHWMASRTWAREIKDETAVNDFDYLKEKRKKELAK